MKLEVKVAYAVYKDRLELSLSRDWIDKDRAVYLIYSNSKLIELLDSSKSKLLLMRSNNLPVKREDSSTKFTCVN